VNAIVVVRVEDPEALQRGFNDYILVVRNKRSLHADFDLLASPLEFPPMNRATTRKALVYAGVPVQIGRAFRFTVLFQIIG
jgi:hypothetical protein